MRSLFVLDPVIGQMRVLRQTNIQFYVSFSFTFHSPTAVKHIFTKMSAFVQLIHSKFVIVDYFINKKPFLCYHTNIIKFN